MLYGRHAERGALAELIATTRHGLSGVLVLVGEPGIGKTALLDHVSASAADLRHVRVAGIESEMDFAYASLQRALMPFMDALAVLPPSQRDALSVACGRVDGRPPSAHLVSLATLGLLAHESAGNPLLVSVDDVQWLDRETLGVLTFVGRRLQAEGIALLMATRGAEADVAALRGLPVMELGGLDRASAIELLHSVVSGPMDARIADRVVAATGGNPLALTDLGSELSSHQLVGGTLLPELIGVGRHLEDHYLRQLRALPGEARAWLIVAATDGTGHPPYVTRAATALSIPEGAQDTAERAGLVRLQPTISFRHPLVRSAIYGSATTSERLRAHRALAEVTTRSGDEDRRAWHLAEAAVQPDEAVAAELERSAERAGARGGYAARASFLVRAAELTPDAGERVRRLSTAAASALMGGALVQARALLDQVDAELSADPTDPRHGMTLMLRAPVQLGLGEPGSFAVAPGMCLRAAELIAGHDPALGQEALLRACRAAVTAEGAMQDTTVTHIAEAILRARTAHPEHAHPALDAFAALATGPYEDAVPAAKAAIAKLLAPETPVDAFLEWYILGVTFSTVLWDDRSRTLLLERAAELARATGALWTLDIALFARTMSETVAGRLTQAMRFMEEGREIREAIGANTDQLEIYRHPELLAWQGDSEVTRAVLQGTEQASLVLGIGAMVSIARIGLMILGIGQGRYAEAAAVGRDLVKGDVNHVHSRVLPDLVEAAARSDDRAGAERAFSVLQSRATASGTPWALALLARCRAVLAPDETAESLYQDALERMRATDATADIARTHLLFGEWLRRQKRRREARDQLSTALEMFEDMGAQAYAERTRTELKATGARARRRTVDTALQLTPQEDQIARLSAMGETNAEIGERLFISARTVDYHLRKIYQKYDIGSRRELRSRYRVD